MSAARPVRLVHLGLGSFFRAHQAWYTDRAPDADGWGIAAFGGRGGALAHRLGAQGSRYTLVIRGPEADAFEVVNSLARVQAASDHDEWLACFESSDVAAATVTITEAGYLRADEGGVDATNEDVRADIARLRRDPRAPVRTAPARIVAGLAARRSAGAGPLALVPCDNLPDNGGVTERVVRDLAERVDPALAASIAESVSVVGTVVDRITPRTTPGDVRAVTEQGGWEDCCPVVTEPFHEWVLAGAFPAGRPRWEDAGATFTSDIEPYERRKLWLLNGGHSLLAYAGSIRGHATVADAIADHVCREWLEQWWDEASAHLRTPRDEISAYRDALVERFENARIRHLLAQIAADGSQKLPVRVIPVLRAERAAGRVPAGAVTVIAAWVCHLRAAGAPVSDVRADDIVAAAAGSLDVAVRRVLGMLDEPLADDADAVAAVVARTRELCAAGRNGR